MKAINFCMLIVLLLVTGVAVVAGQEKKIHVAKMDENGIQTVEIVGGEYYFEPSHIIVKVNVPVVFLVKKVPGLVPHNIVMDEPEAGIQFKLDFGEDGKQVEFTPKKPGKYPFFCSKKLLFFKGHRQRGMEGVLEVLE